jgi:hypothetical protein
MKFPIFAYKMWSVNTTMLNADYPRQAPYIWLPLNIAIDWFSPLLRTWLFPGSDLGPEIRHR